MRKNLIFLLFIVLIFNYACDSIVKKPFNPRDYVGITWTSDVSNMQFTFDVSEDFDGYGNIILTSDNIPILVLFGRANYLTIVDEKKYNENKNITESEILDGTVKLKNDKLILKVLHDKIFDKKYKTITFMPQN